ncbi:SDR family oxidoreductase [soil metagenome]
MQGRIRSWRLHGTGIHHGRIGAALARRYAEQGATLGLVARRRETLAQLVAALPNPERHRIYALDVSDHAALAAAAADFIEVVGGADVVIANAGISRGTLTEYVEDMQVFERIFAVNVLATVATFTPFISTMKAQVQAGHRNVRLVGIGSVAGMRGLPGSEAYSASKAAVISYCESLRLGLKSSGIRVVTISPGFIDTPMTQTNDYPMPFMMPADKFASAAVDAIAAGVSHRVIPWQMGMVARLLRLMPDWAYDLAFANSPRKKRGPGEAI